MGKKILIVEDEIELVDMLTMRLEASGYDVDTAYDGEEGLKKARENSPKLILLDLMLPKIDGYQICKLLKDDARYADIPIIMFTARAQDSEIRFGLSLGADAYITKPFEPTVLMAKIKELLKK